MYPPAVRSVLRGRGRVGAVAQAHLPMVNSTPIFRASTARQAADKDESKPAADSTRLSTLLSGRQRSAAAASKLSQLRLSPKKGNRSYSDRDSNTILRSLDLRAQGIDSAAGPNVINLRSLRGRSGAVNRPRMFGPRSPSEGGGGAPEGGPRLGCFVPPVVGGFGGRGGPFRTGSRGRGGKRRGKKEKDQEGSKTRGGKLEYSPAQKAYLDAREQGVMTPYTPKVTRDELLGYGPALATDASIGKLETAMRAMRVLGGARAFDSGPDFAHDPRVDVRRYFGDKKPVFFNSMAEKEWVLKSQKRLTMKPASGPHRQAILDATIRGVYENPPQFVDMTDVLGTLNNYHNREATFNKREVAMFNETVLSLMPGLAPPTSTPNVLPPTSMNESSAAKDNLTRA